MSLRLCTKSKPSSLGFVQKSSLPLFLISNVQPLMWQVRKRRASKAVWTSPCHECSMIKRMSEKMVVIVLKKTFGFKIYIFLFLKLFFDIVITQFLTYIFDKIFKKIQK